MTTHITVETLVDAPLEGVWACWTVPEHITKWSFASDDWEAPHAENDLREGGAFTTTMSAKDGSASFDFSGTYTSVIEHELIEYVVEDGRAVSVRFTETPEGVRVVETFEPEQENPREMQQEGWQAILDNFKRYVEGR